MLSNDVTQGTVFPALLLTPKARLIAPLRVWRRSPDDFLLLTEPELGESVRTTLLRARFAAKCEIEPEEHTSTLVFGDADGIAGELPGTVEVLDAPVEPTLDSVELERARIEAGVPAWGHELDESILPAEAGLDEHAHLVHEGLLSRAGADRAAALPRARQPAAADPRRGVGVTG